MQAPTLLPPPPPLHETQVPELGLDVIIPVVVFILFVICTIAGVYVSALWWKTRRARTHRAIGELSLIAYPVRVPTTNPKTPPITNV